jgi:hypothetical protein
VVVRRESLILVDIGDGLWHHVDLESFEHPALAVALGEQVALARWTRGWVLGQDEEWKGKIIRLAAVLGSNKYCIDYRD